MESLNLKIVLILTFGFAFASLLGYLSHRLKLSSILGYLIAGYLIGPYSPGYIADLELSEQLAEIGVILMMFGVGLHFKWQDLLSTSKISIPGAILQTLSTTIVGVILIYSIGWPIETGIVVGLSIGVASTVVLVRVLNDNALLNTKEGHIAVGWLIIEDLITVLALLLINPLAVSSRGNEINWFAIVTSFVVVLLKFSFFAFIMLKWGKNWAIFFLLKVKKTKSHELFTLTILAITFVVASGSAFLLGTSIALGAFIAGIVLGQSSLSKEISSNSAPLQDAFVVIFFLSIGMLFNPQAVFEHYLLFLGVLAIILLVKPVVAYALTAFFKYPATTCWTIAIALAQIGEFSFILGEEASKYKVIPDEAYDILVACAFVTIAINPILFKHFRINRFKNLPKNAQH